MASFLLKVTAITLLLFVLSPSPSAADRVVDTEGNPVRNGGDYYILPHSKNTGGLIASDSTRRFHVCPRYVGTADSGEDGLDLKISSPVRVFDLLTSIPVELTFNTFIPICGLTTPLRWWVGPSDANDKAPIIVGTDGPFKSNYAFLIERSNVATDVYNIKFCHYHEFKFESKAKSKSKSKSRRIKTSDDDDDDDDYNDDDDDDYKQCRDVTILDDGHLGVAKDSPFPVTFKKKSNFPFLAAKM